MYNQTIINNLKRIQQRIEQACINTNRNPNEVRLLLATKTVAPDGIKTALEQGTSLLGENKVQELKQKYEALSSIPHEKHFIGHLQTNKIKEVLKYGVTCIQSLDRESLAEKLQQRLLLENKTIDVFIQVNTSNEHSKFGIAPEHALTFANYLSNFDKIRIKGLMTIGLFSSDEHQVRACFKLLKKTQLTLLQANIPNISPKELSMGMSGDLEIAIEEGATIVRVGTAIFGKRMYPDSYYWNETI